MLPRIIFLAFSLLLFFAEPLLAQKVVQVVRQQLAPKKLKTENVILITLDGFRWRELFGGADPEFIADKDLVADPKALKELFWDENPLVRRRKLLPFIWTTLASQGQLYGNRQFDNKVNLRNQYRFSYPGYNEILTGRADDIRINSNNKRENPNKTVLEFINQQKGFQNKVAVFGSWDVFPYIINTHRSGIPVNAGFDTAKRPHLSSRERFLNELQAQVPSPWSSVRLDAFTHHYALEYLREESPRVVYIAYGETDDFAHDGNYAAYLKSARQTDAFIEELWTWLQQSPRYRNKTTLLITTDHGRGNTKNSWKNHGITTSESNESWFIVIGPDTKPYGEIKQPALYHSDQLASTLAALLGLQYKASHPVGPVLEEVISQEFPLQRKEVTKTKEVTKMTN